MMKKKQLKRSEKKIERSIYSTCLDTRNLNDIINLINLNGALITMKKTSWLVLIISAMTVGCTSPQPLATDSISPQEDESLTVAQNKDNNGISSDAVWEQKNP